MKVKNRLKRLSTLFAVFATLFLIAAPNASALTKNIKVTDVAVKEKSGTITVIDPVLSDNEITSNITFNKKDDFVTFELSLQNNESEKYKIESISDNNANENIEIDYSFSEDYIDAGGLSTVTIKLTYKNTLINVDKISIDDLTIKIYLVNEDGEGGEIIINPTTSDALPFYLVILAVALAGLVLLFKNKKNKVIKIGGVFVALAILFIPLTTLAKEKYEVQIRFTDIDIIGEFETYNITINPGNGDEILIVPVQYGNKLESLPANPSKDGYDFDKWVDNDGNTVTSDTVITGPITVEAQYTIKHYTISYDLDGGSLPDGKTNPSDYTIEDEITVNNPEKLGYTFTGWSGTGIDGKTTNLVISAGSKDERSYVANYSANENTPYTVTHRYQNLDDLSTYTEEDVTEYGETDKTIPAPRQERTGFETPAVQNVKVEADGSAHITYTYDRKQILLHINNSRFIVEGDVTGYYPYGSTIHLTAIERPGYTFGWNDGVKTYARDYVIYSTTVLAPGYVANTDTPYVVNHYKQLLDLSGYELADTQNLTGMTDAPIDPAVNSYAGFKSPAVQHTTIAGDKSTVVNYYYDREMYAFSFNNNENVTSTKPADSYPYETVITLTANTVDGKTFSKWSNDETDNPLTITLTGDLTIEPVYVDSSLTVTFDTGDGSEVASQTVNYGEKATRPTENPTKKNYLFYDWYTTDSYETVFDFNTEITADTTIYARFVPSAFPTVFEQEGECIFNGSDGVLEGENCAYANGENKYIDTGVQLYIAENHDKDYEIGFTIVSYNSDENVRQATFMNSKMEGSNYPGVVFRKYDDRNDLDLSSRRTSSANSRQAFGYTDEMTVKIYRITNKTTKVQEIFYSINGGKKVKINDLSQFNPEFNTSVWFGATPTNASANVAQRILVGTLSNMYIKLGSYEEPEGLTYTVNFDANGGSVSPTSITKDKGDAVGELPTPTNIPAGKEAFDGWYTDLGEKGVKVNSSYTPNTSTTLYAKYSETQKFTMTFETDGGSSVDSQTVEYGGNATRPSTDPTKEGSTFVNWYTTDSYSTVFDFENTNIYTDTIIYAKFYKDISGATISPSSITIEKENTETIHVTNIEEEYSFSSSDPDIATVDENGVVTGVTKGTAQITITGSSSQKTRTIDVEVTNKMFTISFETNGGLNVDDIQIEQGSAVGYLPSSKKTNNKFDGWYTDNEYTTEVTEETVPQKNETYYAKWVEAVDSYNLYNVVKSDAINNRNADTYTGEVTDNYNVTAEDDIYYYINKEPNNNVIFGGYCWEIFRTTASGGVKIIYNGEPVDGECKNTGNDTALPVTSFNNSKNSPAHVGYMYNTEYRTVSLTRKNNTYKYGSDVSYDGEKYTVLNTVNSLDNTHHYTCAGNGEEECESVYFYVDGLYNYNSHKYRDFAIVLENGKKSEDAINDMLYSDNVNKKDSNIKTVAEKWYSDYLNNYSDYIEDTVYCNNRNLVRSGDYAYEVNGWNPAGVLTNGVLVFEFSGLYSSRPIDLTCSNITDRFSTSNNKAKIEHPIATITADEARLVQASGSFRSTYLLKSIDYWTMTPDQYEHDYGARGLVFHSMNGVVSWGVTGDDQQVGTSNPTKTIRLRPVVSLAPGVEYISGDGSKTHPYIIDYNIASDKYSVAFDANGGKTPISVIRVTKGNSTDSLPTPEPEDGKEFDGWYTELVGGTKIDTPYIPNANVTIYARYNTKKYTVTFDTDGGTEVSSQTISHGGKATRPTTDPTKEGYVFDNWYTSSSHDEVFDFDNAIITEATTIYANFIDQCRDFSTASWSNIRDSLVSDPNYYAVGCEKEVELDMNDDSEPEPYTVRLANTSTPEVCSTEGYSQTACGLVIEFVDIITTHRMNDNNYYTSGWIATEMISYLNSDFYSKLPTDLQDVIVPTYPIVSGSSKNGTSLNVTEEDISKNKIYLLSTLEVNNSVVYDNKRDINTDTRPLDYYINNNNNDSRKKYYNNSAITWWLRSANSYVDNDGFYVVRANGSTTAYGSQSDAATANDGVAPAFRIGIMPEFTVSFDTDGGSEVDPQIIKYGEKVTRPTTDPTKEGYIFDGWYTTNAHDMAFDFDNTIITSNMTIYAKWGEPSRKATDIIARQVNNLGNYTIDFTRKAVVSDDITTANGNGVNAYTERNETVYYYRGEINNNNVVWANKCWKIIRTTATGGTKMIYNGIPSDVEVDGETVKQCNATGTDAQITYNGQNTFRFNNNFNSPADVGYMYGARIVHKSLSTSSTSFTFANDVSYDGTTYTLSTGDGKSISGTWANQHTNAANKYHYFCTDGSTSCNNTKIGYIYYYGYSNLIYYLNIGSGNYANIEAAKTAMFTNTTDSNAKATIEAWFEQENLDGHEAGSYNYEDDLEDTIFCNDRTYYSGSLMDKDTSVGREIYSYHSSYRRNNIKNSDNNYEPSLDCQNQNDAFTKTDITYGNGKLKHKVGLITADELNLAGTGHPGYDTTTYLTEKATWSISPYSYGDGANVFCWKSSLDGGFVDRASTYGLRPIVSLKAGIEFASGIGTTADPYIVEQQ